MKPILPDQKTMYQALLDKDSSYEGIFFVAVKTTGIFCRPTCTARKPKRENVEYYGSTREALLHGYRPCKICKPLGVKGEVPAWLRPLLEEVDQNPAIRLKDADLRERGLEPNRVRRWFKANHGMTFQTYLRTLRISGAFGRIKYGDKVVDAAFGSGYESLSGFTDTFKRLTQFSPVKSKNRKLIDVTRILTPLGPMLAGASEKGVCLLEFIDRRAIETQLARLSKLLEAEFLVGTNKHFDELNKQLEEYFEGKRKKFTVPLEIPGTEFQQKVWEVLRGIPYGKTRFYQEQAEIMGNPKAVRAVARANGDNRLGIIIPCHRVIGKSGELVGYGGGLWRKKYLLNLEIEHS
jgi:AraC family transcriptional regulator of adaptative response/methylated-DNA-[protein]-cysteine methyltransferase